MSDTLFGEDPEFMSGKADAYHRKRKVIRDAQWYELWEAAEYKFHRSGVPNNQRARVAKLIDDLRQMDATPATLGERISQYGRAFSGAVCTLPAIVKNWDACGAARKTRQPGMPSDAEQAVFHQQCAIDKEQCARESRERDKAQVIIQAAPPGVANRLLAEWIADPDNAHWVRFGYGKTPLDMPCVRWIAAEIESMGV